MAVLGYHFIFTAYGFWLPNDPRGSWSKTVRQLHLRRFGPATKVNTSRSLAAESHDNARRVAAKSALRYPPVRFDGTQARAIARGVAKAVKECDYELYALAVLPDHVHLVMAHDHRHIDQIASHIKARATQQLRRESIHPLARHQRDGRLPSPWSRGYWCPYVHTAEHMKRAIRYVEANPIKAGLKKQRWRCVTSW